MGPDRRTGSASSGSSCPQPFASAAGVEFKFDLVRVSGEIAYVSGHRPTDGAEVLVAGKVGDELSGGAGLRRRAPAPGGSIIASLKQELGELDRSPAG